MWNPRHCLYWIFISRVLAFGMEIASAGGHPKARARRLAPGSGSDCEQMGALVKFTARSLSTRYPRPFGASVVSSKTGRMIVRALNAVRQRCDPSAHAEVQAIRLACRRLKSVSLAGHTLYTTCEPCPMCMSAALWAGIDRVVYGATIADANQHCNQIQISAGEVAKRSDMPCVVEGPLLRDECYALFTDPRMVRAFKLWISRKRA